MDRREQMKKRKWKKGRIILWLAVLGMLLTACGKAGAAEPLPASAQETGTSKTAFADAAVTETEASEPAGTTAPSARESTAQTETPSGTETEEEAPANTAGSEGGDEQSGYYTQADIDQAKDAVRDWMNEAFEQGTELKELYYPGDDFTDEFSGSGYDAFDNTGNSMVLGGYFIESDGTERGTSGYPLWVWILRRSPDGTWQVKDAGY